MIIAVLVLAATSAASPPMPFGVSDAIGCWTFHGVDGADDAYLRTLFPDVLLLDAVPLRSGPRAQLGFRVAPEFRAFGDGAQSWDVVNRELRIASRASYAGWTLALTRQGNSRDVLIGTATPWSDAPLEWPDGDDKGHAIARAIRLERMTECPRGLAPTTSPTIDLR